MQPVGDITFDHVITWQIENIISQLLQRLQSRDLVGTHMRTKWYRCYMSRDLLYVIYYIILYLCHSFMSYMSCDHIIYFIAQLPRRL